MGQKVSWKFLFPGGLWKSQVIKNLEEEISAAGKIFLLRNLEAGCVSSLWLLLYCFSERQAKTSTKKLLGNLFANSLQKFNENKNRIAGFNVFILPVPSYPFNFQTKRANSYLLKNLILLKKEHLQLKYSIRTRQLHKHLPEILVL